MALKTLALRRRRVSRHSFTVGVVVALLAIVTVTSIALLFTSVTPASSPVWVYLVGTLGVSFLVFAVLAATVARLTRSLMAANDARSDADLAAHLADLLLRTPDAETALPAAAQQVAHTLGLPSVSIEPGVVPADQDHAVLPLHEDGVLATVIVPANINRSTLQRLRDRTIPSLEKLLKSAREREDLSHTQLRNYARLCRIADEQAALRNLATLVAQSAPPSDVFNAVAREMAQVLGTPHTVIARYEPGGRGTVATAGTWNYEEIVGSGSRWDLEEGTASELVWRTRAPGRVDAYPGDGRLSTRLRDRGILSSVGCPIMVGRELWGVAIASSTTPTPLPADTEDRMLEFTQLAATAIANAQSHADLISSRARVVTATDETRRRIERDLHDGTQQNLVSIGLQMRAIEATIPPELKQIRQWLSDTALDMDHTIAELQEISRGLHPAILARGGLRSGLAVLARRSAVPVQLTIPADLRLPEHLEITVYYVVSEALTNVAKHARATIVYVDLTVNDELIRLLIRDDGTGGADPARGSGLSGLIDRINALGGRMDIVSPAKRGTVLNAEIPWENCG